jgi:hypothetical protein
VSGDRRWYVEVTLDRIHRRILIEAPTAAAAAQSIVSAWERRVYTAESYQTGSSILTRHAERPSPAKIEEPVTSALLEEPIQV